MVPPLFRLSIVKLTRMDNPSLPDTCNLSCTQAQKMYILSSVTGDIPKESYLFFTERSLFTRRPILRLHWIGFHLSRFSVTFAGSYTLPVRRFYDSVVHGKSIQRLLWFVKLLWRLKLKLSRLLENLSFHVILVQCKESFRQKLKIRTCPD